MIIAVLVVAALLGGTTWLAQNQAIADHPTVNRRLTAAGLLCCLVILVVAVIVGMTSV